MFGQPPVFQTDHCPHKRNVIPVIRSSNPYYPTIEKERIYYDKD